MRKRVVMFSGGIGSWMAARRVADAHGTASLTLLFCDTLIEDPDLYRFIDEAAADIGVPITRIADGRTPFEVFRDERFLGNSRMDPCSKILKRKPADRWFKENCDKAATTIYVGIDWTEGHRFDDGEGGGLRPRRAADGWTYEAPMMEAPFLLKPEMLRIARERGLTPSRSYVSGFPHDNCGGGCCKAGQGQWAHLLRARPAVYAAWEQMEESMRELLGDVSMMTDRVGDGKKKPLTLRAFRERIEAGGQVDAFAFGGCGCFVDA